MTTLYELTTETIRNDREDVAKSAIEFWSSLSEVEQELLDEAADLEEVAANANHLSEDQQQLLLALLRKHETLFDGSLGHWTGEELDIELVPEAKPYHARAFPIPKVHTETLKQEVE